MEERTLADVVDAVERVEVDTTSTVERLGDIKAMLDYDRPLVGALLHIGAYLGRIATALEAQVENDQQRFRHLTAQRAALAEQITMAEEWIAESDKEENRSPGDNVESEVQHARMSFREAMNHEYARASIALHAFDTAFPEVAYQTAAVQP